MGVEFFYMNISPPCRPVWMVLEALEIPYVDRITIIFKKENMTPEYKKVNPRQKIPGLRDDGFCLGESRAIATYLCNRYGKENRRLNLYPQDDKTKALVDRCLYMDVDFLDTIMGGYLNILGVLGNDEKMKTENLQKVKDILEFYEKFLSEHKYIAVNHLTVADFFAYVTVGLLDIVDFNLDNYPKLIAWKKRMSELPYHKKTCEEPLAEMKAKFQEKLKSR